MADSAISAGGAATGLMSIRVTPGTDRAPGPIRAMNLEAPGSVRAGQASGHLIKISFVIQ